MNDPNPITTHSIRNVKFGLIGICLLFTACEPPLEPEPEKHSAVGYSVRQTSDGGYIIAGLRDGGSSLGLSLLIKTNSDGQQEWLQTFEAVNTMNQPISVIQTTDGGYAFIGLHYLRDDVLLIKVNSEGEQEWRRTFDSGYYDVPYSLRLTTDGGFVIVGVTYKGAAAGRDVWLIKTDANGNKQWSKTFGEEHNDEFGQCVYQTADDGYIICGFSLFLLYGEITDSIATKDFHDDIILGFSLSYDEMWNVDRHILLIKTDSNGNEEWSKYIDIDGWGYYVQQTSDGGYIIGGEITVSDTFPCCKAALIKTDALANIEWMSTFDGSLSSADHSVQQTYDGGYIMIVSGSLIKIDVSGEQEWKKTFGYKKRYSSASGYEAQQTFDGGYILVANEQEIEKIHGVYKIYNSIWLIKTDASGNKEWSRILR